MKTVSKASLTHKKCLSLKIWMFFLQYSGQNQNLHVPASTHSTSHSSHQQSLSSRTTTESNMEETLIWKNLHLKGFLSLDAEKHANGRSRWLSSGKKKKGLRLKWEPGEIHSVCRAAGANRLHLSF